MGREHFDMTGIHTVWTEPARARKEQFGLTRLELATMIYSALLFRRLNEGAQMVLWTDPPGAEWARKTGVATIYDGIRPELHKFSNVDPTLFWAGAKLFALSQTECPCIAIDLDCILSIKVQLWGYCTGAHVERLDWECYAGGEGYFSNYGLKNFGEWAAAPVNCGLIGFRDDDVRRFYTSHSIAFMERYSAAPAKMPIESTNSGAPGKCNLSPMVFAEQRMLGMCMAKIRHRINAVSTLRGRLPINVWSPRLAHLWSMKQVYRQAPAYLREAAFDFLSGRITRDFHPAKYLLDTLPLDGTTIFCDDEPDGNLSRTVAQINGPVLIHDPVFPIYRPAEDGCKMWWGEYVSLGDDRASCVIAKNNQILCRLEDKRPFPDYRSDVAWVGTESNLGTL